MDNMSVFELKLYPVLSTMMKALACLTLLGLVSGFNVSRGVVVIKRRQTTSLRMADARITAYQAMLDFNRDFKAGLKFILVPQYELKEKAKAARLAKETLENGMDTNLYLDQTVLDPLPVEDLYPLPTVSVPGAENAITNPSTYFSVPEITSSSIPKPPSLTFSIPEIDLNGLPKPSLSFQIPQIDVPPMYVKIPEIDLNLLPKPSMSFSDMYALKETLTKTFPDKTEAQIQAIVNKLSEVTAAVQERTQQLHITDSVDEFMKNLPAHYEQYLNPDSIDAITVKLSEQYQQFLGGVTSSDSSPSIFLNEIRDRLSSVELLQYRIEAGMPDISFAPAIPVDKFDAVFYSLSQLVQTDGWTLPDIMQTLNFEELGAWYSGVLVGLFLITSLLSKSKTPKSEYPYLAKRTTTRNPKSFVSRGGTSPAMSQPVSEDTIVLETLVSELTMAVTTLSKELNEMKLDKAKVDYVLATMKSDVRTLQNAIDSSDYSGRILKREAELSAKKAMELQSQLQLAEKKVQSLEQEKQSLKNQMIGLLGEGRAALGKMPKAPSTAPPEDLLVRNKIWFANPANSN